MAAYNKFNVFVGDVGLKVHDLNLDSVNVYLTNAVPDAALDSVFADLAEIAAGNGYVAGGQGIGNAYAQAGGIGTLTGVDVVWTAAGGPIGPFRYTVLYNVTAVNGPLIGWWDYGSNITVQDTETFTVDFGASVLTLT